MNRISLIVLSCSIAKCKLAFFRYHVILLSTIWKQSFFNFPFSFHFIFCLTLQLFFQSQSKHIFFQLLFCLHFLSYFWELAGEFKRIPKVQKVYLYWKISRFSEGHKIQLRFQSVLSDLFLFQEVDVFFDNGIPKVASKKGTVVATILDALKRPLCAFVEGVGFYSIETSRCARPFKEVSALPDAGSPRESTVFVCAALNMESAEGCLFCFTIFAHFVNLHP